MLESILVGDLLKINNRKAFTIIEVVLVLAVAGLIFLVVFQAIPRLQRSRRDSERKDDLRFLMASFEDFIGNTGQAPTYAAYGFHYPYADAGFKSFCGDYMYLNKGQGGDHEWDDPTSGTGYTCLWTGTAQPAATGTIHYAWSRKCDAAGSGMEVISVGPVNARINKVAAVLKLERGFYCLDNS